MKTNYILRLQQELAEANASRDAAMAEINHFIAHLHGPKFAGNESGERRDWISTGDVITRLIEIRSTLNR